MELWKYFLCLETFHTTCLLFSNKSFSYFMYTCKSDSWVLIQILVHFVSWQVTSKSRTASKHVVMNKAFFYKLQTFKLTSEAFMCTSFQVSAFKIYVH